MDMQVKAAVEYIVKKGIKVGVDPSGLHADVYVLTLPNGDQYECLAAGLVKLAGTAISDDDIKAIGKKL